MLQKTTNWLKTKSRDEHIHILDSVSAGFTLKYFMKDTLSQTSPGVWWIRLVMSTAWEDSVTKNCPEKLDKDFNMSTLSPISANPSPTELCGTSPKHIRSSLLGQILDLFLDGSTDLDLAGSTPSELLATFFKFPSSFFVLTPWPWSFWFPQQDVTSQRDVFHPVTTHCTIDVSRKLLL